MANEQRDVTNEDMGAETIYELINNSGETYKRPGKNGAEIPAGKAFEVAANSKEYEALKDNPKFELFRTRSGVLSGRKERRVSGFQRVEPTSETTTA